MNQKGLSPLYIILSAALIILAVFIFLSFSGRSEKPNIAPPDTVPVNTGQNQPLPSIQAGISPSPAVTAVAVPPNSGRSLQIPVLNYHYIGNNPIPEDTARDALSVAPDKFDNQIGILKQKGYSFITLDTMYAGLKGQVSLPPKPVILTFDDGYVDFYLNAFPILKKYNAHAVAFLPTGLIGTSYYMSWSQVKEIDASGLVSFQAHSQFHRNLPSISQTELVSELTQSKGELERQLGKPVNFMAYPEGASNSYVWDETQKAGYLGAVGTYYGTTISEGNLYNMPRIKVSGSWSDEEFSAKF